MRDNLKSSLPILLEISVKNENRKFSGWSMLLKSAGEDEPRGAAKSGKREKGKAAVGGRGCRRKNLPITEVDTDSSL